MTATGFGEVDRLCVNALRTLSIDQPERANSGHPGLPMGAAPMAYVLWQRHLGFSSDAPDWPDRDRFVLSAGHGSALIYSLLHLYGFDLPLDELERFRQWDSRTPGHPEHHLTPGIEATTGPLGQGAANSVGMAMAERWLAERYNRPELPIVDHHTFALVSDGDIMEGVVAEASAVAGFLKLGKLIWLYDDNNVTLDGPLSQAMDEDVAARYRAYGWHVQEVADGDHDLEAIDAAITAARAEAGRPSLILVRTTIGFGSPSVAGSHKAHGSPLGHEDAIATKRALEWPEPEAMFYVPDEARSHMADAARRGRERRATWLEIEARYASEHPELAAEWRQALSGRLPDGWDTDLPVWDSGESIATRAAAGIALNAIAGRVPWLLGGDADLASSTKTTIEGSEDFDGTTTGRNIHYGVREHAMGSISNGMAYHGGVRPYAATFFVFSDYMRPAVRLAALNRLAVVYVWTHDSIGVGEDGPTHQPVEHLASLRAMPNLTVLRPADANEAAVAWRWTMTHTDGPVALVLSRQKLPVLDRQVFASAEGVTRGAYVLADAPDGAEPDVALLATGSEVTVALAARGALSDEGIGARVVSMPSWEIFAAQDEAYRDSVLPPDLRARVSIEAGVTLGWERWIGDLGVAIGVDRFGASAPGATVLEKYGITAEAVVEAARTVRAQLATR